MPNFFFDLTSSEQRDLLNIGASRLGMQPFLLEKDVWVCWALDKLFSMPGKLKMAFKGGTSLSKVYKAIDRFSEDIDITIDFREFAPTLTGRESRSKLNKLSNFLKGEVLSYTKQLVRPYIENCLKDQFGSGYGNTELSSDGEKLYIHYESVLDVPKAGYISPSVLLEFGGRNVTEPHERHIVKPYLIPVSSEVLYPQPTVTVLAMERTYWEKATLIHAECRRSQTRADLSRISRHWYDLFKMSGNLEPYRTGSMYSLLVQVVQQKVAFYQSSSAGYDDCLNGSLRLVPGASLRAALENDFVEMQSAGMFYINPPSFEEILDCLHDVENELNGFISERAK